MLGKVELLRNVMLRRKNVYKTMHYMPTRTANLWKRKVFFVPLELCSCESKKYWSKGLTQTAFPIRQSELTDCVEKSEVGKEGLALSNAGGDGCNVLLGREPSVHFARDFEALF